MYVCILYICKKVVWVSQNKYFQWKFEKKKSHWFIQEEMLDVSSNKRQLNSSLIAITGTPLIKKPSAHTKAPTSRVSSTLSLNICIISLRGTPVITSYTQTLYTSLNTDTQNMIIVNRITNLRGNINPWIKNKIL